MSVTINQEPTKEEQEVIYRAGYVSNLAVMLGVPYAPTNHEGQTNALAALQLGLQLLGEVPDDKIEIAWQKSRIEFIEFQKVQMAKAQAADTLQMATNAEVAAVNNVSPLRG